MGEREDYFFETEEEARRACLSLRRRARAEDALTVEKALEKYEAYLHSKGNKPSSVVNTIGRLRGWFQAELSLMDLTPGLVTRAYGKRVKKVAPDTHRGELSEIKTWLGWCVKQGLLKKSPADQVEPVGRRKKGKPQLRRNEAQLFSEQCFKAYLAGKRGWEAALGNLLALWLGMRSGEVCNLQVRDVDPGPTGEMWLWVAEVEGKTESARRRLEVPPELAELLGFQVEHAQGKGSQWLFPANSRTKHRGKTWLRKAAHRLCEDAEIPYVPPHGLRGTQSTLAMDAGATGHLVAQQLGHASTRVTEEHYLERGAMDRARVRWGRAQMVGSGG